jgi:hypothetical protein
MVPAARKGNTRRDGFHGSDWIESRGLFLEHLGVGDLDGQNGDHRGRQADQDVGAQAGRAVLGFRARSL